MQNNKRKELTYHPDHQRNADVFKFYVAGRVQLQKDVDDHGDCQERESEEGRLEKPMRCKKQAYTDANAEDANDLQTSRSRVTKNMEYK